MPDFPILGPLQAAYFAMKNKSRSSAAQKWSKQHGLEFAPNSKTFTAPANPMMKQHVSDFAAHSSRATTTRGEAPPSRKGSSATAATTGATAAW